MIGMVMMMARSRSRSWERMVKVRIQVAEWAYDHDSKSSDSVFSLVWYSRCSLKGKPEILPRRARERLNQPASPLLLSRTGHDAEVSTSMPRVLLYIYGHLQLRLLQMLRTTTSILVFVDIHGVDAYLPASRRICDEAFQCLPKAVFANNSL
jgi:hypothetical protein